MRGNGRPYLEDCGTTGPTEDGMLVISFMLLLRSRKLDV